MHVELGNIDGFGHIVRQVNRSATFVLESAVRRSPLASGDVTR